MTPRTKRKLERQAARKACLEAVAALARAFRKVAEQVMAAAAVAVYAT